MSIIDRAGRILESSTGADLCCDDIIEKIKNDLHPGQLAFVDDQDTQIIGLSAGYGAGKTRSLCAKAVQLAINNKVLQVQ